MAQEGTPRPQFRIAGYALDPLLAANALGAYGPQINAAAAELFLLRNAVMNEQLRLYSLGQLDAKDIAGGYTGVGYRLSPDVFYKREPKNNPIEGGPNSTVEFITLRDVPMMDWDTPDDVFHKAGADVRHLGDVEALIRGYQRDNPYSNIRLYKTPGGFRGFEFGETATPYQYQGPYRQLGVDPMYASLNKFKHNLGAGEIDDPGFRSRISGKPGRIEPGNEIDFVATPIATFRGGEAQNGASFSTSG